MFWVQVVFKLISVFLPKIKKQQNKPIIKMALQTVNPTQTAAWAKLQQHYNAIASTTMQELFQADASRVEKFNLKYTVRKFFVIF